MPGATGTSFPRVPGFAAKSSLFCAGFPGFALFSSTPVLNLISMPEDIPTPVFSKIPVPCRIGSGAGPCR